MLANLALLLSITATLAGQTAPLINESPRAIPLAADVDVLIAGGSSAAVSAAIAAAQAGARVFLAAQKTYLGDDLCAAYRLWLEPGENPDTPLAQALFAPPRPPLTIGNGLPFRYAPDQAANAVHRDSDPPRKLMDGRAHSAATDSVQFDQDVTLSLELDQETDLGNVHVLVFQRRNQFEAAQIAVAVSNDAQQWQDAGQLNNPRLGKEDYENAALLLSLPVHARARYLRVTVRKSDAAQRILLGEIVLEPAHDAPQMDDQPRRIPPMPMQIKRVLDEALLNAGVDFLFGCYPTDLLRGEDGNPAGLVIANRAGRQAIRAKCIIDATPRGAVARLAGAEFTPYPAGEQCFRRVVSGPGLIPNANLDHRKLPAPLQMEQGGWGSNVFQDAYEYTLRLPMPNATFAAFAEAEQSARDATWSATLTTASERIYQTPPDALCAKAGEPAPWNGPEAVPMEAFQPKNLPRIYVLGGCAGLTRTAAENMLRPLAFLKIGHRIGREAAREAKTLSIPEQAAVAAPPPATDPLPGDIQEVLNGWRPTQSGLPVLPSPARSLPVLGQYDVVVVGGGTGGAPAGIAAARNGARTLVIEYLDALGGVGTLGLIGSYYYGFLEGFTNEADRGVAAMGGQAAPTAKSWNVEWKMEWYRRELRKAGADIWFGVLACGTLTQENRVTGVAVATPDGRGVVLAKTVIDATGNADVAFAAGAPCMTTTGDHAAVQGTGLPPRKPGQSYTNTDYTLTDDSDITDAWRTHLAGRAKYADAFDLGVIIDSRERRRILGDFVISPLDIWNQRTYPDSIGLSRSNFDTHGFTVHALFALQQPGEDEVFAYTPYRSLLPKGIDGILVTGLAISAHRDAMPILRMQSDIQNQGYAAGCAAALAAQADITPRQINIKTLQKHLVEKGNLPASVLTDADSYPLSRERIKQAVDRAASGYNDAAAILTCPKDALPLLKSAFATAESENARLIYAHILGILNDPTGADALLHAVQNNDWDSGWSFTGMGQFGPSLSRMDSYLIALARTQDPRAFNAIAQKAASLDAKSPFSHHRAIAIAFETLARPEAAPVLADLLNKPGMAGYACKDPRTARETARLPDPNLDRDRSIRELLLARALFRCGDDNALAKNILGAYATDLRGHLAQHAAAILQQKQSEPLPENLDIERWPAR